MARWMKAGAALCAAGLGWGTAVSAEPSTVPAEAPAPAGVAQELCDAVAEGLRVLDEQLTTEEYGMALRKDTPELTKAVNGAITKLKADGTYAAIVKKWFSNSAAK